jgi:hypothetical protein
MADGLFGPFIVRQPVGRDPNDLLYDLDEHVLLVYDSTPDLAVPRNLDLMHVFDPALPRR